MARILVVDPDPAFSQHVAQLLQRFDDRVIWASTQQDALEHVARAAVDLLLLHAGAQTSTLLRAFAPSLRSGRPPIVLVSEPVGLPELLATYHQGIAYNVMKPFHARELVSLIYALLRRQQRIVCLGGGTGLYTLLLGLKTLPNVHLTSVVSMSDDGGSTGRIREAFGVLPPGDVRRSLVALSTAPALMNEVMQYRFSQGEGLKDHNLGNLLLTAMAHLKGSMAEAVRAMGDILNIQGLVFPVTTAMSTLAAQLADGTTVRGERHIDVPEGRDAHLRISRLWHEPEPQADANVLSAILAADAVLLGPGDLFTSVIATLTVKGIGEAIQAARGRTLYICNLMTKPGETSGFTVADHVQEIVRYLGADALDEVFVSNTTLSQDALRHYARKDQAPVALDPPARLRQITKARIVAADIGREEELVRHDSAKLAAAIAGVLLPTAPDAPPRAISTARS